MKNENDFIKENSIIFKKYRIIKKIGQGSFGAVYMGKSISENKEVALKFEKINETEGLLKSEAMFLYKAKGSGVPELLSFGKIKNYYVLVEPLLGKNLYDIFDRYGKGFSIEDTSLIAIQVLDRIRSVHSKFIIHRDIKPDNFLVGKNDPNVIYIVDFGLSKKYRSEKTKKHVQFSKTGKLTGTVRFSSANALRGGEQSRKDDLISIGYMFIFFMRGTLPWSKITAKTETQRYVKIFKMKKEMKPEILCYSLPKQMEEYMKYVYNLSFDGEPDYTYLRRLFKSILDNSNRNINILKSIFSWIKKSDIPKLKNVPNSGKRSISPQARILQRIEKKLKSNNRGNSSDSSESSTQVVTQQVNNMKMVRNNSNDLLEQPAGSDYNHHIPKKNTTTMIVNLNKTINENLMREIDIIDDSDPSSKEENRTHEIKNQEIISKDSSNIQKNNKFQSENQIIGNIKKNTDNSNESSSGLFSFGKINSDNINDVKKIEQKAKEQELNVDRNLTKIMKEKFLIKQKLNNKENKLLKNKNKDDIKQNLTDFKIQQNNKYNNEQNLNLKYHAKNLINNTNNAEFSDISTNMNTYIKGYEKNNSDNQKIDENICAPNEKFDLNNMNQNMNMNKQKDNANIKNRNRNEINNIQAPMNFQNMNQLLNADNQNMLNNNQNNLIQKKINKSKNNKPHSKKLVKERKHNNINQVQYNDLNSFNNNTQQNLNVNLNKINKNNNMFIGNINNNNIQLNNNYINSGPYESNNQYPINSQFPSNNEENKMNMNMNNNCIINDMNMKKKRSIYNNFATEPSSQNNKFHKVRTANQYGWIQLKNNFNEEFNVNYQKMPSDNIANNNYNMNLESKMNTGKKKSINKKPKIRTNNINNNLDLGLNNMNNMNNDFYNNKFLTEKKNDNYYGDFQPINNFQNNYDNINNINNNMNNYNNFKINMKNITNNLMQDPNFNNDQYNYYKEKKKKSVKVKKKVTRISPPNKDLLQQFY